MYRPIIYYKFMWSKIQELCMISKPIDLFFNHVNLLLYYLPHDVSIFPCPKSSHPLYYSQTQGKLNFFSQPSLPKTSWLRQWHLFRSTTIFKLPRPMPLHQILPMIFCLKKDQLIWSALVRICSSTICWSQNLSWCLDHFGENVFYHVCVHQNKHTILLTTVSNTK